MKKAPIIISCEGYPAPGADWSIEVKFRPLSKGFSVWLREDNLLTQQKGWHKIGGGSQNLNWRVACNYLSSNDGLRVYGDFWGALVISGAPNWTESIFNSLFIEDEDVSYDFRAIAELLLGLNDTEIQDFLHQIGQIPDVDSDEANQTAANLESLAHSCRVLDMLGLSIEEILSKLGLVDGASLQEIATRAEQVKNNQKASELLALPLIRSEPQDKASETASAGQEITTGGVTLQDYWIELSHGPLPVDHTQIIRLLTRWLQEPNKPKGGRPINGITDTSSEWPILKWLLGPKERILTLFRILMANESPLLSRLIGEVAKRGKAEARYFETPGQFSGWATSMIGRPLKRSYIMTALDVQEAADELNIPFPELYRIGDLPYL